MCDCVPRDVCYMWDRVRGRVQNPHVHGDVKNRNPSRKHICAGDIIVDILFSYVHGLSKNRNPSRKHILNPIFRCYMGNLKIEIHHVSTFLKYI